MGDIEFAELYGRNVGVVYKMCYVYLKNSFEAEDAVQTVFLKLLQAEIQFSSKEHERAWLITSSKNQCQDVLKSWWRRRRTSLDAVAQIAQRECDSDLSKTLAGRDARLTLMNLQVPSGKSCNYSTLQAGELKILFG